MSCQLLNIKKKLLINFNEIKKEKTKLKTKRIHQFRSKQNWPR